MKEVVDALKTIGKGSLLLLLATSLQKILEFPQTILLARTLSKVEFGAFSLSLKILGIFVLFSSLGLGEGLTRFVSFYRGKGEIEKAKEVILSSLKIIFLSSSAFTLFLIFISPLLGNLYHQPKITLSLLALSISLPLTALTSLIISAFRGCDNVYAQITISLITYFFTLIFLLPTFIFRLGLKGVVLAYLLSSLLTFLYAFLYFSQKMNISSLKRERVKFGSQKELLKFSLPLLGQGLIALTLFQMDTLMLGYFKSMKAVASYQAALSLNGFISFTLAATVFLYTPVATKLYAKGRFKELKRVYQIATKWTFFFTCPIFLLTFLFPKQLLTYSFGTRFNSTAYLLQLLAIVAFSNAFFGPNGPTLIALGKTQLYMWDTLSGGILNFLLNLVLIPPLGTVGAAVASLISLSFINLLISYQVYKISQTHVLSPTYLKPLLPFFLFLLLLKQLLPTQNSSLTPPFITLIALSLLGAQIIFILFTKSVDPEERTLWKEVPKLLSSK